MKELKQQKKYEALEEQMEEKAHAPNTSSLVLEGDDAESVDYASVLGTLYRISELAPMDGVLLFAELLNAERYYEVLSAWFDKSPAALRVAVHRARNKLKKLLAQESAGRDVATVMRAMEPLVLMLAEAALTSKGEWPDPDDDPSGGSPRGRRGVKSGEKGIIAGDDRSGAMASNKSADERSEGLLAILVNHAARTKKPIPGHLFAAAGAGLLDTDACEALRAYDPTRLESAEKHCQKSLAKNEEFIEDLIESNGDVIHVSRQEQRLGKRRDFILKFTLVTLFGELTTDVIARLKRVLEEQYRPDATPESGVVMLDLSAAVFLSQESINLLLPTIGNPQSDKRYKICVLSRQAEMQRLLSSHGVTAHGSCREAALCCFINPEPKK